jgi:hypothetical protein
LTLGAKFFWRAQNRSCPISVVSGYVPAVSCEFPLFLFAAISDNPVTRYHPANISETPWHFTTCSAQGLFPLGTSQNIEGNGNGRLAKGIGII